MKKGLTEIVFILDKSGSMAGLEKDTIGGYNSFIEKQKNVEGQAFVSTLLFNNETVVIHDRIPIEKIEIYFYILSNCKLHPCVLNPQRQRATAHSVVALYR